MRVCDLSADDLYDGELQGASNAKSLLTALKKRVNAQAFGNRKQDKKGSVTSVVKSGAQKRILEPSLVLHSCSSAIGGVNYFGTPV